MPNPWTGKGNPYTRSEVLERLHDGTVNLSSSMYHITDENL